MRWTVAVPGLAHSSPIVWGDRVFVTTAISSRGEATFQPGLYGEGTASEDRSVQRWMVMALDRGTGRVVWQHTAYEGVPREKRHIKATYANATPATDGRYVVAFFGSQGLYGFDMDGRLLWKKDLGVLNAGAYDLPDYEWGTASSPIIYKDLVIVQCDTQNESFVLAADIATGRTVWKTVREELPSWGTPTVYPAAGRPARRARHQRVELHPWLRPGHRRGAVAAGRQLEDHRADAGLLPRRHRRRQRPRPERPIFAIRPGARATSRLRAGAVVQCARGVEQDRPRLVHADAADLRGRLYVLANQGLLDAYDLRPGEESTASGFHTRAAASAPRRCGRRPPLPVERGRRHLRGQRRPDVRDPRPLSDGRAADGHARTRREHDVRDAARGICSRSAQNPSST